MTLAVDASPPLGRRSIAQTAGLVLSGVMALYMAFNAARAFVGPVAFAQFLGAPLADPADTGFVTVYAWRAAFIALLVGWLALQRNVAALRVVALTAVVMPVGDAILVHGLGASTSLVARHAAIAVLLIVLWALLGVRRQEA